MNDDFERKTAPENIVADQIFRARFFDGFFQNLRAVDKFSANKNKRLLRLRCVRAKHDAFDELMRIVVNHPAVFVRAGFGFVRIDDKINRLAGFAIEEFPLHARRKACTAAPFDSRLFDFGAKRCGIARLHRFFQRFVTAGGDVGIDIRLEIRIFNALVNDERFLFVKRKIFFHALKKFCG